MVSTLRSLRELSAHRARSGACRKLVVLSAAALLLSLPGVRAAAQAPELRVGLLLPAEPPMGAAEGAQLGADEARQAARLLGGDVTLVVRTAADAAEARAAAQALIADERVTVLIGGYDAASFDVLRDAAGQHEVLFLNSGWSADEARSTCRPLVFHVVASDRMREDARALWRATAAGDDSAEVHLWHGSLERFGAGQLNDRYRLRFGQPMTGAAWAAWMAVKVAWEGAARARSSDGAAIARFLASSRGRFDGHKGVELSFRPWDHQLRQPLQLRAAGSDASPEDVPGVRPGEQLSPRERLDRIGAGAAASAACAT